MEKKNSFFKGLLFGALAGATAGILFAPKSGEETRAELKKKAGELKNKAQEYYKQASEMLEKKVVAVKEAGKTLDKTKYSKLVDEVVAEVKVDTAVTKTAAKELGKQLKDDWKKFEKALKA